MQECLLEFKRETFTERDCQCGEKIRKHKMDITKYPPKLILHLARFNMDLEKMEIQKVETLVNSPLTGIHLQDNGNEYNIYAVCNHYSGRVSHFSFIFCVQRANIFLLYNHPPGSVLRFQLFCSFHFVFLCIASYFVQLTKQTILLLFCITSI